MRFQASDLPSQRLSCLDCKKEGNNILRVINRSQKHVEMIKWANMYKEFICRAWHRANIIKFCFSSSHHYHREWIKLPKGGHEFFKGRRNFSLMPSNWQHGPCWTVVKGHTCLFWCFASDCFLKRALLLFFFLFQRVMWFVEKMTCKKKLDNTERD